MVGIVPCFYPGFDCVSVNLQFLITIIPTPEVEDLYHGELVKSPG